VSATLAKLFRGWRRISRLEHPDAYLRRVLVTTYLDEGRRPWRQERPMAEVSEPPPVPGPDGVVDRVTLLALPDRLPPRRRAVLVLRFYHDLSVEQVADALDYVPGTVKATAPAVLCPPKPRPRVDLYVSVTFTEFFRSAAGHGVVEAGCRMGGRVLLDPALRGAVTCRPLAEIFSVRSRNVSNPLR
jgi:hypothetical protein